MSEINISKIRELGREKGMSLVDLATLAGQTPMAIYRWGASNPGIDKVKAVADVLGVTVDELLKEEDDAVH